MEQLVQIWPIIQTLLTGITLLVTGLVVFIVKGILQTIRDLRTDHEKMEDRVNHEIGSAQRDVAAIREMIAGQFIKRDESNSLRENLRHELHTRMDRIDSRLLTLEQVIRRIDIKL